MSFDIVQYPVDACNSRFTAVFFRIHLNLVFREGWSFCPDRRDEVDVHVDLLGNVSKKYSHVTSYHLALAEICVYPVGWQDGVGHGKFHQ